MSSAQFLNMLKNLHDVLKEIREVWRKNKHYVVRLAVFLQDWIGKSSYHFPLPPFRSSSPDPFLSVVHYWETALLAQSNYFPESLIILFSFFQLSHTHGHEVTTISLTAYWTSSHIVCSIERKFSTCYSYTCSVSVLTSTTYHWATWNHAALSWRGGGAQAFGR